MQQILSRCVNGHETTGPDSPRKCPVCGRQITYLCDPRFSGQSTTAPIQSAEGVR